MYKEEEKIIKCAFYKKIFEYESTHDIPVNFAYLQLLQAISLLKINNNCMFTSYEDYNSEQFLKRRNVPQTTFKCTV